VSYTENGKTATPKQQLRVLELVRRLETDFPPSPNLLTDTQMAKQLLDGVWYLQYTSPSDIVDIDDKDSNDTSGSFTSSLSFWKPQVADEGAANIETKRFEAKGTISAGGVPVSTSNRDVQQNIDVANSRVVNE